MWMLKKQLKDLKELKGNVQLFVCYNQYTYIVCIPIIKAFLKNLLTNQQKDEELF